MRSAWPFVAYSVGAAGLTVGTIFGLRSLSEERKLHDACPDRACPPECGERIDGAKRDAMVSNIGFGVGLLGVAVGSYLLLSAPQQQSGRAWALWLSGTRAGAATKF